MQQQQHHLAAILFTDIVGYTDIMQRDELQAVAVIRRYNTVLEKMVIEHQGEVVNDYGDGSLCTFNSATEAIKCAIEIQQELQREPAVPLRIGLHIGEIFYEDGKVLGDGVNVASRIQSLGQANTILFSGEINNKIKNQQEFKSVSLGRFEFKNVDEPVEVFALANEGLFIPKRENMEGKLKSDLQKNNKSLRRKIVIAALAGLLLVAAFFIYSMFFHKSGFTGKEKSIAVLPFTNMSADKDNEYFSDGITDDIITQLSKIADIRVISRTTSMRYKNSDKSLKEIAEELKVAAVLEGSVQRTGNNVRIRAQLIDASTDEHIWAENYDREVDEIFAIQSEVALHITYELNARLSKEEKLKIEKKPTNNTEAYDLYLRGRYALYSLTLEGFHNAEILFRETLKKDPEFRLAYSYLAQTYVFSISIGGDLSPSVGVTKALQILNKSLQNDTLNIDFETFSFIEFWARKNYSLAEYYMRKAISINPNDPNPYLHYASLLTMLGRTEDAGVQINKAKKLDPINIYVYFVQGENYYAAGKYDDAIKTYKEAIQMIPSANGLYDNLGRAYIHKEKYQEALQAMTVGLNYIAVPWPSTIVHMAIAYFKLNNTKKSGDLMQELKQRGTRGEKGVNFYIAVYYSAINNKEEAFKYLDQALNTNDADLIWLKQEPSFKNIHSDPRYQQYLKKAGFN